MNQSIIVWKDGSFKHVDSNSSWEYENDLNWLVTIPLTNSPTKPLSEETIKWIPVEEYPIGLKYHPSVLITNGTSVHEAIYNPQKHLDKPRPFFSMPGVRDGDSRFYTPTHYAKMPSSYIDVTPETK